MTTSRELSWDKDTQLLKVKAVTEDVFKKEQVKAIYSDLQAKLKQANTMLNKFKDIEFALKKMEKEPRLKEIIEIVLSFLENAQMPDKEAIEKTINYWKDSKIKLEKDISDLAPIFEKLD